MNGTSLVQRLSQGHGLRSPRRPFTIPARPNLRNFLSKRRQVLIESRAPLELHMNNLVLGLLVQVFLAFGVAGLLWPDKLMPLFGILLFPWRASERLIRAHGIVGSEPTC